MTVLTDHTNIQILNDTANITAAVSTDQLCSTNRSNELTGNKLNIRSSNKLIDWFKQHIIIHLYENNHDNDSSTDISVYWHDDLNDQLIEYITNQSLTKLILYIDSTSRTLQSTYGHMSNHNNTTTNTIQYFIKITSNKPISITLTNINTQLQYGCICNTNVYTLHTLMQSLYVPLYTQSTWPSTIKKNVNKELYKFMNHLLDITNTNHNYTILYLPSDIECQLSQLNHTATADNNTHPTNNQSISHLLGDKDLVQRIEGIVIHWTRQIKEIIGNGEHHNYSSQSVTSDTSGLLDEIEFWMNRSTDLSNLKSQLDRHVVCVLVYILQCTQSSYLHSFQLITQSITLGTSEAYNNLQLLQLIQPVAYKLSQCAPVDIIPLLPELCNRVRLISSVSTYYNTDERICSLLRLISNQIIIQCMSSMNINELIQSNQIDQLLLLLRQCIDCCTTWHSVYDTVRTHINQSSTASMHWKFDQTKYGLFAQLDAFIQRCYNLIELCAGQLQFCYQARYYDHIPLFGGSRGVEMENILNELNHSFKSHINKYILSHHHTNILSMQQSEWYTVFTALQSIMKEYDLIVHNTLQQLFDTVYPVSLPHCIDVLHTYSLIAVRSNLQQLIKKKSDDCIVLYNKNYKLIKHIYEQYKKSPPIHIYQSRYTGSVQWAKSLLARLHDEYHTIIQLQYIDYSEHVLYEIRNNYIQLVQSINDYIKSQHNEWLVELNTYESIQTINDRLNQPLLTRVNTSQHSNKSSTLLYLQCNYDSYTAQLLGEIRQWNKFHHLYSIPHHCSELSQLQSDSLHILYEYIMLIVRDYNTILYELSESDRLLFYGLIKSCDYKIQPGLNKLTWNQRFIKDWYYNKIHYATCKLAHIVHIYKSTNTDIHQLCQQMGNIQLLHIVKNKIYDLHELYTTQLQHHQSVQTQLQHMMNGITTPLHHLYSLMSVTHSGTEFDTHWHSYIQRIDEQIECSLKYSIKSTLNIYYTYLNTQSNKTDTMNLYNLYVQLNESTGKIEFSPSVNELQASIKNISKQAIAVLQCLPRLTAIQFNQQPHSNTSTTTTTTSHNNNDDGRVTQSYYDIISNDHDILKLLVNLIQCSASVAVDTQRIITHYDRYSSLWMTDKSAYIRRYGASKRPLSSYEMDLNRYKNTIADIQSEDQYHSVGYIRIDCTTLKHTLIQHCSVWQTKLTTLLYTNTQNEFNLLHELFRSVPIQYESNDIYKRIDLLQSTLKVLDQYDCVVDDELKEELDRMVQLVETHKAEQTNTSTTEQQVT